MDSRQAAADLAEVRFRLAGTQRFGGFSGAAAAASGVMGLAAGAVQFLVAPHPAHAADLRTYFAIWYVTLAIALAVNYGAVAMWLAKNRGQHAVQQSRLAAFAMLPAIALGGVLTLALVDHGMLSLVPGVWYGAYAVRALCKPRARSGRGAHGRRRVRRHVARALAAFESLSLAWWVMPLGFGFGQVAIGLCLARERAETLL